MGHGGKKRGLANTRTTIDALKSFVTPKAIKLFGKYKVLSKDELHSRYDIYVEQYAKHINIEAQVAMQMVNRRYIPAVMRFMTELGSSINAAGKHATVQKGLLAQVGTLLAGVGKKLAKLEAETIKAQGIAKVEKQAMAFRDLVLPALTALRQDVDSLEAIMPSDLWPVPCYSDLLFKL